MTPFKFVAFLFLVLGSICCQAQEVRKNHADVELLGNGIAYSLNYERTLSQQFNVRIGINKWETDFLVPVTVGKVFGEHKHHFELAIGNTVNFYKSRSSGQREVAFIATAFAGYRYTSDKKPFVFRAGFTPWYVYEDLDSNTNSSQSNFVPWAGVSFGYLF